MIYTNINPSRVKENITSMYNKVDETFNDLSKSEITAIESITKEEKINTLTKGIGSVPLDTKLNWSGHELIKSQFGWQIYDEGSTCLNKAEQFDIEKGRTPMPLGAHATWAGVSYLKTAQGWKPVGKNRGHVKENHDVLHKNADKDKDHHLMTQDAGKMTAEEWTKKHGTDLHSKYKAVHDYLNKERKVKEDDSIINDNVTKIFNDTKKIIDDGKLTKDEALKNIKIYIKQYEELRDNVKDLSGLSEYGIQRHKKLYKEYDDVVKEYNGLYKLVNDIEEDHGIEIGKEYGHDLDGKVTVTKVEKNTGDKADRISHIVTYKNSAGQETTQGINGFKNSTKDNHQESALVRYVNKEKNISGQKKYDKKLDKKLADYLTTDQKVANDKASNDEIDKERDAALAKEKKIIGKTSSGKDVYEKYNSFPKEYDQQDLLDASKIHNEHAKKHTNSVDKKQNHLDYASAFSQMAQQEKLSDVNKKEESEIPEKVIEKFNEIKADNNYSFLNLKGKIWRRDNKDKKIIMYSDVPNYKLPD